MLGFTFQHHGLHMGYNPKHMRANLGTMFSTQQTMMKPLEEGAPYIQNKSTTIGVKNQPIILVG